MAMESLEIGDPDIEEKEDNETVTFVNSTTNSNHSSSSEGVMKNEGDIENLAIKDGLVHSLFVSEFDIDKGSVLRHRFPINSLQHEVDDDWLAERQLPEGVHDRSMDETWFFLEQKQKDEKNEQNDESVNYGAGDNDDNDDDKSMLYVLNIVCTRRDKTVRRGARVMSLAAASKYPYLW